MPEAAATTQGDGGEVEQAPLVKRRLTTTQALAAQLMRARGVINTKNAALANLGTAHAKQIADLQTEIAQLRAQTFQAQIDAEIRENELLVREHDLPDVNFSFKRDAEGWYAEFAGEEGESEEPEPDLEKEALPEEGTAPPAPEPEPAATA